MTRILGVVAVAVLLCINAGAARASGEDLANTIAAEIMSPFCPGVTLENCPSDKAVELRAHIQSWAEQGWGKDRIMAELEDLYGQSIRAIPPKSGTGLGAWLAPGLAVLAGLAAAAVLARRWTRRGRTDSRKAAPVPPETRARLAEELDALRGRP